MEEQASVDTSVVESTAVEEVTTGDAFLEGWDDGDGVEDQPAETVEESEPEETTTQEPESQETETTTVESVTEQTPQVKEEAPKIWKLKHLDSERAVGESEMVALAQKGMDYDRIRGKYDESKPAMEMLTRFAQKANMTVDAYVENLRVKEKRAAGLEEAAAKKEVDLENREAKLAENKEQETQLQGKVAQQKAEIAAFREQFPEAAKDPKSIPPEVFEQARKGMGLVAAYAVHLKNTAQAEAKAAKEQVAALEQNQTNAKKSAGSMRSAGNSRRVIDPFLSSWDD